MSKIDRVTKSINDLKAKGLNPSKVRMSRKFAIALKSEMVPTMDQHFIGGRMTVYGVPWELDNAIRGYSVETELQEETK